jgi:hypothetical protein
MIGKLGAEREGQISDNIPLQMDHTALGPSTADALGSHSCKQSNFRKIVRKVINHVK